MRLHELQLAHYSPAKHDIQYYAMAQADMRKRKPRGLWVSVDSCKDNWPEWCAGEQFRIECLLHRYIVKLNTSANILHIDTPHDLGAFTECYSIGDYIHWADVAKEYDGIIIAPHQYEVRLTDEFSWYYTWDCASGCLWGANAVESITYEGETGWPDLIMNRIADREHELNHTHSSTSEPRT
jgi:hypothetical protein